MIECFLNFSALVYTPPGIFSSSSLVPVKSICSQLLIIRSEVCCLGDASFLRACVSSHYRRTAGLRPSLACEPPWPSGHARPVAQPKARELVDEHAQQLSSSQLACVHVPSGPGAAGKQHAGRCRSANATTDACSSGRAASPNTAQRSGMPQA